LPDLGDLGGRQDTIENDHLIEKNIGTLSKNDSKRREKGFA
jgi:hypothetical protein